MSETPTPPHEPATALKVAALCLFDTRGALLLVRKRNTQTFMLPGGKLETGETPLAAACREAVEETGCVVAPTDCTALGVFECAAANEPDLRIVAHVFEHGPALSATPRAAAEIAELRWLLPDDVSARTPLAPLLHEAVLPALRDRN